MIRVETREGKERHGIFEWDVKALGLSGRSRQPLLDAARALKRMGASTEDFLGLFRAGKSGPDATAKIGVAAGLTVSEPNDGSIRFVKWKEFSMAAREMEVS